MQTDSSVISLDDARNKKQMMKSKKPNNHKCQNIHFQRVICKSIPVECDEGVDLEHLDEVGKEELQIALGEKVDIVYGDDPFPTDPDDVCFFDDWHLCSEDTTDEPLVYVFRGLDGKLKLGATVPATTKCVLLPPPINGSSTPFFVCGSVQSMKTLWDAGKIDEVCKYLV